MPPRLVDASLASQLVRLQCGTGQPIAPKRVELSRAPADEAMLLRFFGCPLRFRAAHDALVALDVTDPEQAKRAVAEAVDAFGRVDVLVDSAGTDADGLPDFAETGVGKAMLANRR